MQILGYLETYENQTLIGWAFDRAAPGRRLLLAVEVDGEPIAAGLANLDRSDVAGAGHGDGRCGFRLRAHLSPWAPFRVVEVGSGTVLFTEADLKQADGDTEMAETAACEGGGVQGHVDNVLGTVIQGWCWRPSAPDSHPVVTASIDGRVVASCRADLTRGDLVNAGIGEGDHAFNLRMPYWTLDGVEHDVEVAVEGEGPLSGSPIRFIGLSDGGRPLLGRLMAALPQPGSDLTATARLLDSYLEQMEMLVPQSLGFAYYPDWYRAQAAAGGTQPPPAAFADDRPGLREAGLRLRAGDGPVYLALLDEGVRLLPGGLERALRAVARWQPAILYADAQAVVDGTLLPWFRPDWSYDLCLAQDYTRGLTLIREDAMVPAAGNRTLAGARTAALLACDPAGIRHLPEVVCTLATAQAGPVGQDVAGMVAAHLAARTGTPSGARSGESARLRVIDPACGLRRVDWPPPADAPLVSLIIPTRDRLDLLRTAVDSIIRLTSYDRFEIIIIDNQSRDPETLAWLADGERQGRFERLSYDAPFNYADMNNKAAAVASGDIVGFINNDVELITPDWLQVAVGLLARPEVGAVGARLRFANGMIQHGGIVAGTGGLAENAFQHVHVDDAGYFHRTRVAGNYSAVTAACLFCHRQEFLDTGGFDAANLPVAFNDVDFCLRLRERDRQIVWTPHIELFHYESVSRGQDSTPEKQARAMKEALYMRQRWARITAMDPYYSPNLNLDGAPFSGLAVPPRRRWGQPA
ncbi:glycosyltransferase family 2 protein [Niveispirillum fermenti]|uniref:glycosyltransferase family 2 protein n=1 Tax=Niveispirillum fermenti TaxID=1233113 RepID=UPI003A888F3D